MKKLLYPILIALGSQSVIAHEIEPSQKEIDQQIAAVTREQRRIANETAQRAAVAANERAREEARMNKIIQDRYRAQNSRERGRMTQRDFYERERQLLELEEKRAQVAIEQARARQADNIVRKELQLRPIDKAQKY